jgi:Zn-dependent peptidase ImmA (M78 family)
MTRFQAITQGETAARDLLRKHSMAAVPTDLKELCRREGIIFIEKPLDDELSGMSFVRNGLRFVVANARHQVLRRDELSAEGVDLKEIGANAFAAELLMPRSQTLRYSSLDLADEPSVAAVAQRFGVSATALTYRLSNLANRI